MTVINYKNGRKNHWRRWQWNRIAERLPCSERDAIVLYLAGATDLDRQVATRTHSFNPANLFAVERDKRTYEELRKSRVPAIHATLDEAIRLWPTHTPIAAVVADFVGGLTRGVFQAAIAAMHHSYETRTRAVLALNLRHEGRDVMRPPLFTDTGLHWNTVNSQRWRRRNRVIAFKYPSSRFSPEYNSKHRGLCALRWVIDYTFGALRAGAARNGLAISADECIRLSSLELNGCSGAHFQYKSTRESTFDSMILRCPRVPGDSRLHQTPKRDKRIRQSIVSRLAIRTGQRRGTIQGRPAQ